MPDLNTENPHVVNTLYRWVHDLVQTYHVDALRIDTVKHIRKDFWPGFVEAGGVAVVGEVLHGGESPRFFARQVRSRYRSSSIGIISENEHARPARLRWLLYS
jgi:glycosidase